MIPGLLALIFTVSPTEITINETTTARVESEKPLSVETLRAALLKTGEFLLIEEKVEKLKGSTRYEWKLEPLRSGTLPLSLNDGGAFVVAVKPFDIPAKLPDILPLPLDPHLPPDLSPENQALMAKITQSQPARNRRILNAKAFPWHELLFALAVILGGFAWIAYLDWKERNTPPPTPEALALKALETLNQAEPASFAERIGETAEILRGYIQDKYRVMAPYLTTDEFLKASAEHPELKGEPRRQLGLFLSLADQVKFSGHSPSKADADTAFSFASAFIDKRR